MIDRATLRLASTLLVAGELLFAVAGYLHPAREFANDHSAAFAEYAASGSWTAVHLGQFVGIAVVIAGFLVLFSALDLHLGAGRWAGRFAAVSAVTALALCGVLQGVDGVALKQAVDVWSVAPEAEKAARFAAVEAVRWLEWGIRSYQSFLLGLSFVLMAAPIVTTGKIPRMIGVLMAVTGLGLIAQGWVIGSQGFARANAFPTIVSYICWLAWSTWLLVKAWSMRAPDRT
jgi:hypothetical protein